MNEVLKTGVWTQDDWGMVMDKWVENPPPEYLMFLPVWIRLRNIPVNHYTKDTISRFAEYVGRILDFPFDVEEAQSKDYVRVRVLLDVSRRLRNSKGLQLPNGSVVSVGIDYERIRKRCFQCQRMTHDKTCCPFTTKNPITPLGENIADSTNDARHGKSLDLRFKMLILPLFKQQRS
ncbi:PREDICTED: uncharacterized protein At4g02000-like [Camelina sativa]|uniref:Uncharacterized protein At4g02000-like n=1 Tax=Camelina sativa TaxID=90675 RepID=A0ABM0YIY6_CAMSA|nr:PREDICTED: uncharacterized protein At4g02000-like [Camelina sativa]